MDELNIKIDVSEERKCRICEAEFSSFGSLGSHVGAKHKIPMEEYLIEFFLEGERPLCNICAKPTQYKRGRHTFMKYCVEHKKEAQKEWSKKYGYGSGRIDAGWKRGLTKNDHAGIASQAKKISGKNNVNFLSEEIYADHISKISDYGFNVLCSYQDFRNSSKRLHTLCQKCGHTFKKHSLNAMMNSIRNETPIRCNNCNPFGRSIPENEVYDFILSLGIKESEIKRNYRELGKEIDIYIPSKKFAVEYNGLFWHSSTKKGIEYHKEKSDLCREAGVKLFHIFSDEWRNKKEIVFSMIRAKMGMSENRIFARNCEVAELNSREQKAFFDKSHLDGSAKAFKTFALKSEGKVVSAMSVRHPKNKYSGRAIEIARFANALDTTVPGSFSRLLKYAKEWATQEKYDCIFSFADYRFSYGEVYEKNGFSFERYANPSYWISDGKKRMHRTMAKGILEYKDVNTLDQAGLFKVYGCGNFLYKLTI